MPESGLKSALALDGVRVLALEASVSGPHCSRILGDMGAEVIKVEKPGTGDLIRGWDSVVRGLSSGFVWLNGNKRSFAVDIKNPAGREAFGDWPSAWMWCSKISRREWPIVWVWDLLSSAPAIRASFTVRCPATVRTAPIAT